MLVYGAPCDSLPTGPRQSLESSLEIHCSCNDPELSFIASADCEEKGFEALGNVCVILKEM